MAAYAALLALARSLQVILDLEQQIDPLHKEKIVSLLEKVDFIVTFLEDHSDLYHQTLGRVGNEIRKAAYEAQDFMDSYYCSVSTSVTDGSSSEANADDVNLDRDLIVTFGRIRFIWEAYADEVNLDRDLTMAFERIGFIWEELMKTKNRDAAQDLRSVFYSSPVDRSSTVKATAQKMVVGFHDNLIAIKERLYGDAAELQIIPIVGMGGVGKTTLARSAYDDSPLSQRFDISAWITVSADYQRGQILSGLLHDLEKRDKEQSHPNGDADLETLVYKNLKGRRYLIVVDDIWSVKAWDDLKRTFPNDGNGSRILLTTRILDVAAHLGSSDTPVHQMNCLNEDQSWKLLQERVFGQQSCPLQLVEVGKKIAKNCGGLPLAIVVVAGLLLSMNEELWENVAENISIREPTIALQCSKILCISYDRLPLRLKPCFLYVAAFPEDSEIDVSKLIKLWVAEGFLKPTDQSKCLEAVGERYVEDLVNRSLLLVSKKGPDGKLETVGIHDMLREICIAKAEEEGFLHHVSSKTYFGTELRENPYRRLTLSGKSTCVGEWKIQDSSIRSILLFPVIDRPGLCLQSRHLYILDAPDLIWTNISAVITTFVNLRYLSFTLNYSSYPHGLPVSISKLPNLETIVVTSGDDRILEVPYEILKMPKLRHLIGTKLYECFRLSYPSDIGIVHESDLQTMGTVLNFTFAEEIIKILVNLKKLKVVYDKNGRDFNFDNLFHLQNLEDLEINERSDCYFSERWSHAFPIGLKKLYLVEVPFPWENMTLIGSLPNLQMLHMIDIRRTQSYSEWRTVEGQFLQLKYFCSTLDYLTKWETEKEHFPVLESLILKGLRWSRNEITEIPRGIGEIDTLRYIEVWFGKQSLVNSAMQIQKLQRENGNDDFRVRIIAEDGSDVLF